MKNKVIITILAIASLSVFAVSIRQPEFTEGVGKAWGVLFATAEVLE